MDIPHFVHKSIHWWPFGFFLSLNYHKYATNTDRCQCEHMQPSFFLTETRLMMRSYVDSMFNHLMNYQVWTFPKWLVWTKILEKKLFVVVNKNLMEEVSGSSENDGLTCCIFFLNKSQSFDFTNNDSGRRCWGYSLLLQRVREGTQLPLLLHQHLKKPLLFPTISNQCPQCPSSQLPLLSMVYSYNPMLASCQPVACSAFWLMVDFILTCLQYSSRKLLD